MFQARNSKFEFPIYIQEMYPTGRYLSNIQIERNILDRIDTSIFCSGKYDLKWKFWERKDNGEEVEIACFLFTIKII